MNCHCSVLRPSLIAQISSKRGQATYPFSHSEMKPWPRRGKPKLQPFAMHWKKDWQKPQRGCNVNTFSEQILHSNPWSSNMNKIIQSSPCKLVEFEMPFGQALHRAGNSEKFAELWQLWGQGNSQALQLPPALSDRPPPEITGDAGHDTRVAY